MYNIINGDLLSLAENGMFDIIVHGCNCFNTMGAGIAKQIKQEYPIVYKTDCKTIKGDVNKLGKCGYVKIIRKNNDSFFTIVNAYTQYYYGLGTNVNYNAIKNCFKMISYKFDGLRIGYPKIGAGLAGGDWNIISNIINEELKDQNHSLVIYDK